MVNQNIENVVAGIEMCTAQMSHAQFVNFQSELREGEAVLKKKFSSILEAVSGKELAEVIEQLRTRYLPAN